MDFYRMFLRCTGCGCMVPDELQIPGGKPLKIDEDDILDICPACGEEFLTYAYKEARDAYIDRLEAVIKAYREEQAEEAEYNLTKELYAEGFMRGKSYVNVDPSTLPVGTKFFVNNGNWHGEIIEENGVKLLWVAKDRKVSLNGPARLDITIEGKV